MNCSTVISDWDVAGGIANFCRAEYGRKCHARRLCSEVMTDLEDFLAVEELSCQEEDL